MKRKYLRTLLLAGVITAFSATCILMSPDYSVSRLYAAGKENAAGTAENVKASKDETVYGVLNYDGSVGSIYVVNRFNVPQDGIYKDFGDYATIENLSNNDKPEISGDTVQWDLKKSSKGFYYKGVLKTTELPWHFDIKYNLDGAELSADALAGRKGKVEITIAVSPDEKAKAYFKDNYAMQIQVPVNLNNSTIISAEGATRVIAGKTGTLAYTVLPGASQTYKIILDTEYFEMDSINIGLSAIDYSSAINTGDISEGFDSLGDGMGELVDGTSKLKDGIQKLADGIKGLADGQDKLAHSGSTLIKGMEDYDDGLKKFNSSVAPMAEGSKKINNGLSQAASSGKAIAEGYKQVEEALKAQLPGKEKKEQLKALAQYADSPDAAAAQMGNMAKSMLEQIAGLEQLYNTISTLNSGLVQYTSGVSGIAGNYKNFDNGISQLPAAAEKLSKGYSSILKGNKQFVGGMSSLNTGMSAVNKEVKAVPDSIQKLIDGQKRIKSGVDEAEKSINEVLGGDSKENKMISFVSPEKGSVNSVQFILRTPGITVQEAKSEVQEKPAEKTSFIEKLIALFTGK